MKIAMAMGVLLGMICGIAAADEADDTPNEWQVRAGVAVLSNPRYPGARTNYVLPVPAVDARWGEHLEISLPEGVSWHEDVGKGFSVAVALGADLRWRSADSRFAGLPRVPPALARRISLNYDADYFYLHTLLLTRLAPSAGKGESASGEAGIRWFNTTRSTLTTGIEVDVMNSTLARNFYSVPAAVAIKDELTPFEARAGVEGLGGAVTYYRGLNANWGLYVRAEWIELRGDARSSPITLRAVQPGLTIAVLRGF